MAEILQNAGMLECFYTDVAGNIGPGKWLAKCGPLLGFKSLAKKLRSRQIPECVLAKTVTLASPFFSWRRFRCCKNDPENLYRQHLGAIRRFGLRMATHGFGKATHLYSMLGECGPAMSIARTRGLSVVTEIYILLSAEKIVAQERRSFPGWEPGEQDLGAVRKEYEEADGFLKQTELFICPSEAVQHDLANWQLGNGRSAVVPYGVSREWLSATPEPTPGRVLFVGTAELRKGIHYFARAAELLQARGRDYEFRVAGNVSEQVASRPECRQLTFLGRVSRREIQREYRRADIFVLPTLAEGSSESTYEALAMGLPTVTTRAAGGVARDGLDGWIVPERDPVALAMRIEEVVEDRNLRDRMSKAARDRAADYTHEKYGERLIRALRQHGV